MDSTSQHCGRITAKLVRQEAGLRAQYVAVYFYRSGRPAALSAPVDCGFVGARSSSNYHARAVDIDLP